MQFINIENNKYTLFIISLLLFAVYFSQYFIKGKNSYILVHDNLDQINMIGFFDGEIHNSEELTQIEPNMPGIPKEFRQNSFSISFYIFKLFGYFWGFVFNEMLYRLIAFIAFFFLIKNHLRLKIPDLMTTLLSFSFVALPFWPQGYLSVAGVPLLIISFDNLYHKTKLILSYLILIFFPLYSSLSLVGIFVLLIISVIYLFIVIKDKNIHFHYLIGLVLLTVMFVIINFNLLYLQYFSGIVSHRTEIILPSVGLISAIKEMIKIFTISQYHACSLHKYIILPLVFLTIILLIFKREKLKNYLLLFGLIAYITIAAILYGAYYYEPIAKFYGKLGIGFNWARFYFISPTLWFMIFALSIGIIYKYFKKSAFIVLALYLIIAGQIAYGTYNYTYKALRYKPSFRSFVSEEMFDDIKNKININLEKDRIGCIGFFPSVANYNGFRTIGGYSSYYPVEFKHGFREIIAEELSQNIDLEKYFDEWGSRAYLFDNEIGQAYSNQNFIQENIEYITCDLDIEKLKEFGVKFLFSTVRINNASEKNLFEIYRDNDQHYYRMFVYELSD